MQQDKQTTFGSIHDYLKRVNGETENDLDFKAQMKECRALMSQKNEKKASENQTSVATKKPKRVGKPATPKAAASKSVSTKPEVAKPIASKLAERSEPKGKSPFFQIGKAEEVSSSKPVTAETAPPSSFHRSSTSNTLDDLWQAAAISKAKKPKEKQVWIDTDLCHQLELLNLKHGKPSNLKHIINGILQLYVDEHKTEIRKISSK
jgi:hypothetical protein